MAEVMREAYLDGTPELLCWLCRYRHKWHYADLGIMPMPGVPALAAGVWVRARSA
jgi:hypothetical protein